MDVDAVRLSDEEYKKRLQERLCFKCGRKGHQAKDCRNPFANKEGKKPKKTEVSAKIEEIPDSDEEPTISAVCAQDF